MPSLFDTVIDRHNSDSVRYDVPLSSLPLTVADTDFPTSPYVVEALRKRIEHPLFGYVKEEEAWKNACADFYQKRFGLSLNPKEIGFSTSVLGVITAFIRAYSKEGDGVIVTGPVYNCFYSCIEHTDRTVVDAPLLYHNEEYHFDMPQLAMAMETSHLLILCSPHNPLGIAFGKEELDALFHLAKEKGCLVLSDEIHGLVYFDKPYVPSLSLPSSYDNVIMASSPSKAFNTAGIQAAFFASKNEGVFRKVQAQIYADDCGDPSCFAQPVLEACYLHGDSYLDEFNSYLRLNRDHLLNRIQEDGRLKMAKQDYTYLAWLDVSTLCEDESLLVPFLEEEGLLLASGSHYGKYGKGHLRLNFALPRSQLEIGLDRLFKGLDRFQNR